MFIEVDHEINIFKRCFEKKLPLLLKGPTGCGKSQLVEFMANQLNRPLVKISCNEDTNAADLLGRFLLQGGATVWVDGPVTQAVKTGAILYLDEIAEAREDVIVALHPLTDHRRELYVDKIGLALKAHADFFVVASFNPGYQKGIKDLKPSTKQRFVGLSMSYLPADKEQSLIQQLTNCDSNTAKKLVDFANKIRGKGAFELSETVSTRLLIYAAQLACNDISLRRAAVQAIAEVLSDDRDTVEALKDLAHLSL